MGKLALAIQNLEASQRSANIDRIILEDSQGSRREHKVLLLGEGQQLQLVPKLTRT